MIRLANFGLFPAIYQHKEILPSVTGQVRWNGNSQEFEVCDTYGGWNRISSQLTVSTSNELETMMSWVKGKMQEEKELKDLLQKYPSLENAHTQFLTVYNLVKQHDEQKT